MAVTVRDDPNMAAHGVGEWASTSVNPTCATAGKALTNTDQSVSNISVSQGFSATNFPSVSKIPSGHNFNISIKKENTQKPNQWQKQLCHYYKLLCSYSDFHALTVSAIVCFKIV